MLKFQQALYMSEGHTAPSLWVAHPPTHSMADWHACLSVVRVVPCHPPDADECGVMGFGETTAESCGPLRLQIGPLSVGLCMQVLPWGLDCLWPVCNSSELFSVVLGWSACSLDLFFSGMSSRAHMPLCVW